MQLGGFGSGAGGRAMSGGGSGHGRPGAEALGGGREGGEARGAEAGAAVDATRAEVSRAPPALRAAFGLARGSLTLDVAFDLRADETVALVGPNGAGKTTCLHALAGLLRIDRGRIVLGDEVLDEAGEGRSAAGRREPQPFVPPAARRVGLVFQQHLLFEHLSVLENVAYGPRSRGTSRHEASAKAFAQLERVGLAHLAHARPAELSGGQAQRVALARALASGPRMLLLDEPLAAVDASARIELRRELRRHLATFAGVRLLVAHDIADALALADRLLVLENGRIVQNGTIADLVARPRSRFVADLVGINVFRGVCAEGLVTLHEPETAASGDPPTLVVAGATAEHDGPVLLTVHPRAVSLFRDRPQAGSPRNLWLARVAAIEPLPDRVRIQLAGRVPVVAEVTPAAVAELDLVPGREVYVAIKATEIDVSRA
jgi:molybdate transport system ATP-binding protein